MDPVKTIETIAQVLGALGSLLAIVNAFNGVIAKRRPALAAFLSAIGPHVQDAARALRAAKPAPEAIAQRSDDL